MALPVPPTNDDLSLRYYTTGELAQIDIRQRGTGEEHNHIHEEMGPDGSGATRMYSCAWEERFAAALVMTGYAKEYTDSDSGDTLISRLLPESHPEGTKFNWVCTKVQLSPWRYLDTIDAVDFGQPMPRFERCDFTAVYELVPYQLLDDAEVDPDLGEFSRYVIKPGFPGADVTTEPSYLSLPGGILKYTTADGTPTPPAGVPIPYNVGFVENYVNKEYVWERVPQDVWGKGTPLYDLVHGTTATRGMIGSLNKTAFDGHPALTLMLMAPEERLLPDPSGQGYSWRIVYKMREKPVPFGHLGFYFHSTASGTSALNGYYEALSSALPTNINIAAAALGDKDSLFIAREFKNLFNPNG